MHIIHAYITTSILKLAESIKTTILKKWGNVNHKEEENLSFYDWTGLIKPYQCQFVALPKFEFPDSQV